VIFKDYVTNGGEKFDGLSEDKRAKWQGNDFF